MPPERLNQEGFTSFAERAGGDAPVVMLNLLAFKPEGGRRYEEYGEAVAPPLERAGARVAFTGNPASVLLGGTWCSWSSTRLGRHSST